MKDPIAYARSRYRKYGEISWTKTFGIKVIQMWGGDANQFVLQNQGNLFSSTQAWQFFIGKFFNRGVMLLDFEEHRYHRRILQTAFTKPSLDAYLKKLNPAIDAGINCWSPGNKFMVLPSLKKLTLDLATDVFMGCELGSEANSLNQAFVDCVRGGTAILRFPVPFLRWHKGLKGREKLEQFFASQIEDKRKSLKMDMFSQLCRAEDENGESFTDQDVINHMIFLMMAAHDTTTITLSQMFYHLAKHPQWQEKLRQESLALHRPQLEFSDLDKLAELELVMKESLRLCPPVPGIPRKTVRDSEFKGIHIPKGSLVTVSPNFSHRMDCYWPNPDLFDPNRFSEHRREDKVHPYAFVAFGGGAHKCIGLHFADMQVKAILHQVLLKYRWQVDSDYTMPMDYTSLPVPADKLPVQLQHL